ncbi:ATP-dependent RNA helicase DDX55/SPB4 [Clonorchis sinensis]|uniref:ATP-dependent RNA helicase DDX55/SPB4 n=1 Tax=Clonorchis sinensis TaxID=79923 RepID=H2KNG8_CLOSI|nr:ATP-dependent RNA helicase DDX55/SPB4 [Clonorchis sinensis]
MTDWDKRVLTARAALCKVLQEHHAFIPKHSEIFQLSQEFESLKELVPTLTGSHSLSVDGDHTLSASVAHSEIVSTLREALDMHANCVYLLDVHRAIDTLSTSVRQLCQCVKRSHLDLSDQEDDARPVTDDDPEMPAATSGLEEDLGGLGRMEQADCLEIDSDTYSLYTSEVVSALEEVEKLLSQPTKFNKDNTLVFQGFCLTLRDCKRTLHEHIDMLWRQCFVWRRYNQQTEEGNVATATSGLAELLNDLCVSTSTLPSTAEMYNLLRRPYDSEDCGKQFGPTKPSPVIASFTVYAMSDLLVQLFRLTDALNDSAARFNDLSKRLWELLFEPWLEKARCTSESSRQFMDWPRLCTHFYKADKHQVDDTDFTEDSDDIDRPVRLPAWRLSLVAPTYPDERTEDSLIQDSCRQLASAFQELHTYVFAPRSTVRDVEGPQTTSSSFVRDSGYFDDRLVRRLIDGRFASVLPSAKKCRSAEFLAPATQAVYSLAVTGEETGFFTGSLNEDSPCNTSGFSAGTGGATLLVSWINDLSRLTEKRRTNEVLAQVRSLLSDPEQFHATCIVGTGNECNKRGETNLDDSWDGQLDEEELNTYQRQSANRQKQTDSSTHLIPSLSQLLESAQNRKDLTRFVDLGHFHFPVCRVSKSVLTFLDQISAIINEAQTYLDVRAAHEDPESSRVGAKRANSFPLATTIVELVPRLLISYTSLIPCFFGPKLEKDLYLACLYHNNCMYLAHECLTLGEIRLYPMLQKVRSEWTGEDTDLLEQLAAVNTCVLVPHFRTTATNLLLRHLRGYRDQLVGRLKQTRGFRDVGLAENRHTATQAVYECLDLLRSASDGLKPLPLTVYYRCMGVLCNTLCLELNSSLLQLIDMTTQDCEVLVNLINLVEAEINQHFTTCPDPDLVPQAYEDIKKMSLAVRRVPELARLRGILSVLTAPAMTVIDKVLWNDGHGALATEANLKVTELRNLIKAIYSSSSARDHLLSKLH